MCRWDKIKSACSGLQVFVLGFQYELIFFYRSHVFESSMRSLVVVVIEPIHKLHIEVFPTRECMYLEELLFEYSPPSFHFTVSLWSSHSCVFVFDTQFLHHLLKGMMRSTYLSLCCKFSSVICKNGFEGYSFLFEPEYSIPEKQSESSCLFVWKFL